MSAAIVNVGTDLEANDYVMARNIAEKLEKHYPGYQWCVKPEGRHGIVNLWSRLLVAGDRCYGYTIRLAELFGDTEYRLVVKAGGEILERYRLDRARADMDKINDKPTFVNGALVFDYHEMKSPPPKYVVDAWNKTKH